MSNDERMLLIELIDEINGGIFEPFLDTFGKVRERVIVELTVHMTRPTLNDIQREAREFIDPP